MQGWTASVRVHHTVSNEGPQANGLPESLEGKTMGSTNGTNSRSFNPQKRKNSAPRRDGKVENGDWLAAQVSARSVQEVVDATGMTDKAVQNIRRRKSKISFDNLVDLCRTDPEFAAEFAAHIGLILPGEAEMAAVVTRLVNAHVRRKG